MTRCFGCGKPLYEEHYLRCVVCSYRKYEKRVLNEYRRVIVGTKTESTLLGNMPTTVHEYLCARCWEEWCRRLDHLRSQLRQLSTAVFELAHPQETILCTTSTTLLDMVKKARERGAEVSTPWIMGIGSLSTIEVECVVVDITHLPSPPPLVSTPHGVRLATPLVLLMYEFFNKVGDPWYRYWVERVQEALRER